MTDQERIARLEEIVVNQSDKLNEIAMDVKSLIASRSFIQGAWAGIVMVAGLVGAAAGLIVTWARK